MKTYFADVVYGLNTGVFEKTILDVTHVVFYNGETDQTMSIEDFSKTDVRTKYFRKLITTNGIYFIRYETAVMSINFR